jgi:nucleotide-binding universal stress UspA family protein
MTAKRPVVAGVDGSTSASIAAGWAADEAASRKATLRIVNANLWPLVHPPGGHLPVEYYESMHQAAVSIVHDAVETVAERYPDLRVAGEVVMAAPAELLLAESRRAQLVVLGSRGLGGFTGLLVGSVTESVAAHGYCPLIVVRGPELGSPPPGPHTTLRRCGSPSRRPTGARRR